MQKSAAQDAQQNQVTRGLSAEIMPGPDLAAQPGEPSLAVRPFEIAGNEGPDPELLSQGMRQDLLVLLAQSPGLKVLSHNPAGVSGAAAGDSSAGNLLQTQIQPEGDRLRIDTQLTDAASGTAFWNSAWEVELTVEDLLAARNRIARDVAQALGVTGSSAEPPALSTNTLHGLGLVLGKLGRFESARAAYAAIRETSPGNPLGYVATGDTYLQQGRLDLGALWISRGQAIDPGDYDLPARVVSLFDNLGHHDGARTWSAWLDQRITSQPLPLAMQAKHHYLSGNFELALQYANLAINLELENQGYPEVLFMRLKRDEAIANGNPAPGIELFLQRYPGLGEQPPLLSPDTLQQAVHLASLFSLNSEKRRAATLLEAAIALYDEPYAVAGPDRIHLAPVKAEALALLGREDQALAELRRLIDAGWRIDWLWSTDLNASFNGIRDSSGFRSMVQELAIAVAAQRISVEDMEAEGKIGSPAEPAMNPELETLRDYIR